MSSAITRFDTIITLNDQVGFVGEAIGFECVAKAFPALAAVADDGPSLTFLKRLDGFTTTPPGDGWDGAWHLERK